MGVLICKLGELTVAYINDYMSASHLFIQIFGTQ